MSKLRLRRKDCPVTSQPLQPGIEADLSQRDDNANAYQLMELGVEVVTEEGFLELVGAPP